MSAKKRGAGLDASALAARNLDPSADPLSMELGNSAARPFEARPTSVRPALVLEKQRPRKTAQTTVVLPKESMDEINALIRALRSEGMAVSKRSVFEHAVVNYILPELRQQLGRPVTEEELAAGPLRAGRPQK